MNHLYVCSVCQVEIEALAKRRRVEIDTFIKVRAWGRGAVPRLLLGTRGELGTEEPRAVRLYSEGLCCGRTERPDTEDFAGRTVGFQTLRSSACVLEPVWKEQSPAFRGC